MNTYQVEEQSKFKISLNDFLLSNGIIKNTFEFDYNPFKVYQLVCRRGGYHAVTNRNEWSQIAIQVGKNDNSQLKMFYFKYIYPYQKKYYFGLDEQEDAPAILLGIPRKMVKNDQSKQAKGEQEMTLQNEISKVLEEQQQSKMFYLHKNKLLITKAESKKIVLGLDAFMSRKEVIYSLNMLLLYSVNSHHPFLFENYEKIFTALSNFVQRTYPPKNQEEMEDIRTVTLIFRNFTMNPLNLKFMLGTTIFQTFVNMFNTGFDHQCSKNIVDIMNGLVKVGWDCQFILKQIDEAILDDRHQDVEANIDLLRSMIDERDQSVAPAVTQNIRALLRVLMSTQVSIQVKEQVFELLAFVTDISTHARQQLLKNETLMRIIIGILQHMKNQQKLIQFVALTLSNMTTSHNKALLKRYETQLMMIGFSDDSLAGIISNILTELSH